MSGGHAPAAKSSWGLHLGHNMEAIWGNIVRISKNVAANTTSGTYTAWRKTSGLVGDILKKNVSATLHIAGGPIAKVLDKTATGVSKILGAVGLGHGNEVKPTALLLEKINSLFASTADSITLLKPKWTNREWHGFRWYFRHVAASMKKARHEAKIRKAEKNAARAAQKNAASHETHSDHNHDHAHAAEKHDDHSHWDSSHAHSPTHGHKETHEHKKEHHSEEHHEAEKHDHGHDHKDNHVAKEDDHSDHGHAAHAAESHHEEKHHDQAATDGHAQESHTHVEKKHVESTTTDSHGAVEHTTTDSKDIHADETAVHVADAAHGKADHGHH